MGQVISIGKAYIKLLNKQQMSLTCVWGDLSFSQFHLRYNNYDRAVINTVPYDVVHRWYTAHRTLTIELRKPENEFWVKLKPGRVGAKLERCQVSSLYWSSVEWVLIEYVSQNVSEEKEKRVLGVGPGPTTHSLNDLEAGSPQWLSDSICMMRGLN